MMDLMDWKNVEASTEASTRSAEVTIEINQVVLSRAKREIKLLGGKTSEEEKEEIKKVKKAQDKLK